jgi:hypothetical protein
VQDTLTTGAGPTPGVQRAQGGLMSPTSWPDSSTGDLHRAGWPVSRRAGRLDEAGVRLAEHRHLRRRVDRAEPLMRTLQRVGSQDGGDTS